MTSSMHPSSQETFHISIRGVLPKNKQPTENQRKFHLGVLALDGDWPYAIKTTETEWAKSRKLKPCEVCKGKIWYHPRLGPQDLKLLARQAGIRIKIRRFAHASACTTGGKTGGGNFQ